ncbi:MAG: hypothetical protein NVSMB18_29360 [Acetobacteraceae bacterium]
MSVAPTTQMTPQPGGPASPPAPTPRFNETARAIVVSLVISLILATLVTGNPFRALVLAYTDYSHTPAAGAPKADPINAPATKDDTAGQKK